MADKGPTDVDTAARAQEPASLFRWETLRVLEDYPLKYRALVPGKSWQVELVSGSTIRVWRADDGRQYFCHGLTFGGIEAPGGPVSPFSGEDVDTILAAHYEPVRPESAALVGDVLVWRDLDGTPVHSAILISAPVEAGRTRLSYSATVRTKNGMAPEALMGLGQLIADYYGESYQVYRRKLARGETNA